MQCPQCDKKLRTTHTYSAGGVGTSHSHICPKCRTRFTSVTMVVAEQPKYGDGALPVARRLEQGFKQARQAIHAILALKTPLNSPKNP